MKRARYQQGCLQRVGRKSGPDVWQFRWREIKTDGGRIQRKVIVGTVAQYPTKTGARAALEALRITINHETSRAVLGVTSVDALSKHYQEKELSETCPNKTYSTREAYKQYLKHWILPRWGSYRLEDVKPYSVEEWLSKLKLANGSKAKIRNVMSALYSHAQRHDWTDKNPITHVRQSAKRERIPDLLSVEEMQALLSNLGDRERTLVLFDAATGLRVSELLALKWEDVDLERLELRVVRSIVHQVIGTCKTEASRKPIPLDPCIAEQLLHWKRCSVYNSPQDWVFASPLMNGKQPYWPEHLMKRYIRPAAQRLGISKRIGWHTFRHTYSTLLKANGEDVKVVQELLRHANSRITLDTYTQALTPAKREAQSKVVRMILPKAVKAGA